MQSELISLGKLLIRTKMSRVFLVSSGRNKMLFTAVKKAVCTPGSSVIRCYGICTVLCMSWNIQHENAISSGSLCHIPVYSYIFYKIFSVALTRKFFFHVIDDPSDKAIAPKELRRSLPTCGDFDFLQDSLPRQTCADVCSNLVPSDLKSAP